MKEILIEIVDLNEKNLAILEQMSTLSEMMYNNFIDYDMQPMLLMVSDKLKENIKISKQIEDKLFKDFHLTYE